MNEIKNENKKFVVKVYHIYPAWAMGQLSGAVLCDNEDEARKIAYEISEPNIKTKVEYMSVDFENELWKEWAEDIEKLTDYNHYDINGLNIITAEEYRENGFELVRPDFEDAVYSEEGKFLGWYDFSKDAVVDARGQLVGYYDDKGNFIREKKESE